MQITLLQLGPESIEENEHESAMDLSPGIYCNRRQCLRREAVLETVSNGTRAVRLGFNTIRGMQRDAAWRIEEARAASPFLSVHDLGVRAALNEDLLKLLAAADALAALTGNRRQAMWVAAGSAPDRGLLREATIAEQELELAAPTEIENTLPTEPREVGSLVVCAEFIFL